MSATRVYLVTGGDKPRMVQATSQAQAIGHCVRSQYKATVATQMDIVKFMTENDPAMLEKASEA